MAGEGSVLNHLMTAAAILAALNGNTAIALTSPVSVPVGSAAAPSLSFTGDATTGFYSASAGKIDLSISGTKVAEWTSTGLSTTQQITSTLATGTAPFVVASTTVVGNLNVSQLLGATWAIPGTIGSTTPNTGAFTTLTSSALTSGRVPFASTGGLLTDASTLTWSGTNLSITASGAQIILGDGTAATAFYFQGGAGTERAFNFRSGSSNRWRLRVNTTAESGSNAGSDYEFIAFDDTGASLGAALTLTRSTRALTLSATGATHTISSTVASSSTTTGAVIVSGGVGIAGAANIGGALAVAGDITRTASSTGAIEMFIQNTGTGTSSRSRVRLTNDGATANLQNLVFNSTNTSTTFGITNANYAAYLAGGASSNGLMIGCDGIAKPIVFGVNAAEAARFDTGGNFLSAQCIRSSSPSAGIGYATGAGGTVTQATSKATGVTLNTVCGQITMQAAALAAGAKVTFTLTDSAIAATDVVNVCVASGGTANAYRAFATAIVSGSCAITVENITAGSLSEAPVISFVVVKAVIS